MVQYTLTEDSKLSEESLKRLAALKDRPIDFSDIPELTPEQIAEIRRQREDDRKKQMFSLRLQNGTVKWWRRTIGEGYTTVMARLLEEARKHPDWIKECL
jgi:uncharacterized protein (DUF4415 family)